MSRLILILIMSSYFTGCLQDEASVPETGSLYGTVDLTDQDTSIFSSYGGVVICLSGTDYVTESDSNGNWEIDDIPIGSYRLVLSKKGFDTVLTEYEDFVPGREPVRSRFGGLRRSHYWYPQLNSARFELGGLRPAFRVQGVKVNNDEYAAGIVFVFG